MGTMGQDLRYGIRMLWKSPGFTAVAVLALALGIGANTTIFSIVNAVLLRPLPYNEPDQIVWIWGKWPGGDRGAVSPPDFLDYRRQTQTFQTLAAFMRLPHNLTDQDSPERVSSAAVSVDFFETMGVKPLLGRTFVAEEEQAGRDQVTILSYGLWQRHYGGDPAILERKIPLDGKPYTVVGVMPAHFDFPRQTDLWEVVPFYHKGMTVRRAHFLRAIGRLKPGVTIQVAQAEMDTIAAQLAQQYPDSNKGWSLGLISLNEQVVGNVRPALLVLLGAVVFVLLIACGNVANLLLARAATRRKEMAIRLAVGASRWRLLRQLLTESIFLALVGGAVGILLALWGLHLLLAIIPDNIPRLQEVNLDSRVLGFTLLISILTGVSFGLAPAFAASKMDVNESLKEGGRDSTQGGHRNRGLLVIAEVALALVLLVGAGLMIRSFSRLQAFDPGFNSNSLLTLQISLPQPKYSTLQQRANFFGQVLERVRTLPGVESAGWASILPFGGQSNDTYFSIEGRVSDPSQEKLLAIFPSVDSSYFQTMGIPLRSGRYFTEKEVREGAPVVVINDLLRSRFFANEDPIGKRLMIDVGQLLPCEIVGIVGNVRDQPLSGTFFPVMYVPFLRTGTTNLVVRTASNPLHLAGAVRAEVRRVDKDQPVANIKTMEQLIEASIAQPRFRTLLLGSFATVALLLAAAGIYGAMAYSVAQRTHEIGIRMALGAQQRDVLKLVVGQGMILVLTGIGIGLVGAFGLTRVMASLLYGVSATDPITFASIALLLTGVALLACYIPARRATKVDPMVALRYE